MDALRRLAYLDATALALIGHDVAGIDDADLDNRTPCEGWTVRDLVRHMNVEHEAVVEAILPRTSAQADDPREDFAYTAARWVVSLGRSRDVVSVPKAGRAVAVEQVLSIHFVDMLVHRWDLAKALRRDCVVPAALTDVATPIAVSITRPGSPLSGQGRAYRSPFPEDAARSTIDRIAARLGRDPRWDSQRSDGW